METKVGMKGNSNVGLKDFNEIFKPEPKKAEGKQKDFKDVLKDLAESSSLHGVPKIVSSRQIAVKVLWCLLFMATFSVLAYQLSGLFKTYYSHPIQTTVSLKFNSINFPAISICNMNPVKNTTLNVSDALTQIMNASQKTVTRKKRSTETHEKGCKDSKQCSRFNKNDLELVTRLVNEQMGAVNIMPSPVVENLDMTMYNQDTIRTVNTNQMYHEIFHPADMDMKKIRRRKREASLTTILSSSSTLTVSSVADSSSQLSASSMSASTVSASASSSSAVPTSSMSASTVSASVSSSSAVPTSSMSASTVSASVSSSSAVSASSISVSTQTVSSPVPSSSFIPASTMPSVSSMVSSSYSSSWDYDDWSAWYASWYGSSYSSYGYGYDYSYGYDDSWTEWVDPNMYIYQQLNSKKDVWDERVIHFRTVFKNESLERRRLMGHQKEDLIMSASFAGTIENVTQFNNFTSSEYGNCYTMSSPKFVAWRSGPTHGIKLTLNIEVDEYIHNFSTGYGVRMVLHEPGTYPLPSDEGITLGPGTETNIGLKMVRISRLGQPYGTCVGGQEFSKRYRRKYTTAACYQFCRIIKTMEVCSCIPIDAPDEISLNTTVLPVCNASVNTVNHCLLKLDVMFNNGEHSCDCHSPCKEVLYEKTMSSRYWPTSTYVDVLLSEICKKNKSDRHYRLQKACDNIDSLSYDDHEKYRNNFLRVIIYFEDLNYETISEEPMYEGVRFLSDIGGATGLFLGASVLSIVEVLQLLLEIALYFWHKYSANHATRVQAFT